MQHQNSSTDNLKQQLLRVFQKLESNRKRAGFIDALLCLTIWGIAFILIEQVSYLSPLIKLGSALSVLVLAIFILWQARKRFKSQKFIEFYRQFANSADIKELGYALDLEKDSFANPKLVEAAIFKNLELVKPDYFKSKLKEFDVQHPASVSIKKKYVVLSLSALLLIVTAINFQEATGRYISLFESFEKPNPYRFIVEPGNSKLEQGAPFVVSVKFENGLVPDDVSLFLKTPVEDDYRKRGMEMVNNAFLSSTINLNTDLTYYIEMDGFKSEIYSTTVQLRPRLVEFIVTIIPPAYTALDTTFFEYPFSQVQGIQGSEMILSGTVNKPVSELLVKNKDFEQDALVNEFLEFAYFTSIQSADTLQFILKDESGIENLNTFRFTVDPIQDEFPVAEILEPSASFEQVDPQNIDLLFQASDDFGITNTTLNYELAKAFVNEPSTGVTELENVRNGVLQNYTWDISSLNLTPKDELSFWIESTDNDAVNGYKSSRSQVITLTVPSLIDYFEEIDKQEEEVQTDLEDISESFEEMQEQYEMFRDQLRENPEVNYQDMRQLQEVKNRQEEIQKQVEELNKKFDELKEELSESNLLSEETLQAYEELEKLMEEIDDPAFREALEQMQENLNSMTPEQLREAMQNTEFNEQLYKERLERTIELFKQLKLNADLEKLAQSYEDLARQEEELAENQDGGQSAEERQESLLEQTEQAEQQLKKLEENTTSKTEDSIDELQEKSREILEQIKKELEKRQEESQSDSEGSRGNQDQQQQEQQPSGDSKSQEQKSLSEQYNQLSEMTRSAMSQMNQQQLNVNIAGLQYILYALINISLEQEDLNTYASAAESRSQAYIGFARDQKNVENIFTSISDSLFQLSTEIPQFSNQINKEKLEVERLIAQSLEQLSERNQSRSSVASRQALGGINKISYLIANLLEQLQNQSNSGSGSGGGMSMQQMIEQMQQMGENQQQINQQIQDMINDIQGERLSQDQMQRLDQLSRQQNDIRKQLQQLQQNGGGEGGDKLGSDLERMIEQMEETINDLRGGAVDPTLIERQQNILSRMLEAEDALQERDEEERREGTAGDAIDRVSPPEITLEELEQQIRNRLNDPNFTKYSPDYQLLIERYFDLLKQIQSRKIQ